MKIMCELADAALDGPTALSIGVFDGVHLGHRYLIGKLKQSAESGDLLSGVVTFDRHPDDLLDPGRGVRYLTTLDEKLALLGELELDFTLVLPFTQALAQVSARDFVLSLLDELRMRELWIGPDFALGRDRQGDADYLRALAQELDFRLEALQPLLDSGNAISSSNIRSLLSQGRVTEAGRLLGRHPTLTGKVVGGSGRGHQLGFPTANLAVDEKMMIPADGIYAVRVRWGTANHQGVVNIGVRPTFDNDENRTAEAHILDFTGDLYGQTLHVEFVKRLRSEQRFESPGALMEQMKKDVAETRRVFGELQP